jgi:hypothetical protein
MIHLQSEKIKKTRDVTRNFEEIQFIVTSSRRYVVTLLSVTLFLFFVAVDKPPRKTILQRFLEGGHGRIQGSFQAGFKIQGFFRFDDHFRARFRLV